MNTKLVNDLSENFRLSAVPFFIALCFLFSCNDDSQEGKDQVKTYYDVKGFIEGQIFLLNGLKPGVSKTMKIGTETSKADSRDIDWKKQLELFVQADINKPAYRQSYEVTRPDSSTFIYVLKTHESLPVQRLTIKLNAPGGLPVKIEALLKSENKLYQSEKHIYLTCIVKDNTARIASYRMEGFQKLVTLDKKPFAVTAELDY